jgi:hypothetical protein
MIAIIIVLLLAVAAGIVFILFGKKSAKVQAAFKKKLIKRLYRFFVNFFLTAGMVRKITTRLQMLSVYRQEEIPPLATKYFLMAGGASLAAAACGFLMPDVVSMLMCVTFAVIINNVMIDKQFAKMELKTHTATTRLFSSLEQNYLRTKSIPDAVYEADAGFLRHSIDEIHSILMEGNGELRLRQYYISQPYRPLQTLAGICYTLSTYGDVCPDGQSGFIRALTIMKSDVDAQIEKITLQKAKFGAIEYMPLIALVGIGPMERFLTSTMPAMAVMYNSTLGFILRVVTILFGVISYAVISKINNDVMVASDDRGKWAVKLAKSKVFGPISATFIPKREKKKRKDEQKIKSALSRLTLHLLYTKKVAFTGIMAVLSGIVILLSCLLGQEYIKNSTTPLSLAGGSARTDKQQIVMQEIDDAYTEIDGQIGDNELMMLIRGKMPELSEMEVYDEMDRVRDKYSNWTGIYFRWYYIWIAFALGILGWFLPDLMLKIRGYLVKTESEDDYMQLQTLVSVLVYTDLDTLGLLDWLTRQSTIHKEMLRAAYHNFPSQPERELERLKSRVSLPAFKYFVDKLKLTVSELPLTEAFSDLLTERETFMRLRRIATEATIEKKKMLCNYLSYAPMLLFTLSEFLYPIGYLGVSEFANALGMLRNM